jgi:hypothetical protein
MARGNLFIFHTVQVGRSCGDRDYRLSAPKRAISCTPRLVFEGEGETKGRDKRGSAIPHEDCEVEDSVLVNAQKV